MLVCGLGGDVRDVCNNIMYDNLKVHKGAVMALAAAVAGAASTSAFKIHIHTHMYIYIYIYIYHASVLYICLYLCI